MAQNIRFPPRRPRFRDDTDFPERELAEAGGRTPRAPGLNLSQRDPFRDRSSLVAKKNETAAPGRRSAYDQRSAWSQDGLDDRRSVSVASARPSDSPKAAPNVRSRVAAKNQGRLSTAKAVGADRRVFNYSGFPKTIFGGFARVEASPRGRFKFKIPSLVYPCVQRSVRRSVLFAQKKLGKGKALRGPRRRTFTSKIGC